MHNEHLMVPASAAETPELVREQSNTHAWHNGNRRRSIGSTARTGSIC
jgi:hypothetical protein